MVNAGFQNPHRPAWYEATQDVIVPKEALFKQIAHQIMTVFAQDGRGLTIVEPGVGLGAFFQYLLTETSAPEQFALKLIGADIAEGMIGTCQALLETIRPRSSWHPISIELHSGINLLDFTSLVQPLASAAPVNVILACQFEHYYPNTPSSVLASKLNQAGLPRPTKHDFRRFVHERLAPGGLYFSLDDYGSGNAALDAERNRAWDDYVVEKFSDPAFLQRLSNRFPNVAESLRRVYNPGLERPTLLKKAGLARQRRRAVCLEEMAELEASVLDLRDVFGRDNVQVAPHPLNRSHRSFYLLRAQRRSDS